MIRALLLDADGVVQRSPRFLTSVAGLVANGQEAAFIQAVFDAEQPCLRGQADFAQELAKVLTEWNLAWSVDEAMLAWHEIQVDATVLRLVHLVRGHGIVCCIASNQQSYRAQHMSIELGYSQLFDHELYSHTLGAAKPDARYFREILSALNLDADEILFIDDSLPNVYAAAQVGLRSEHFPSNSGGATLSRLLSKHGLQVA